MPVDSQSIRLNEVVSNRATLGGITTLAATSVTPSTCIVARIDAARMTISTASTTAVRTPDAAATSGSKVVNSRVR